MNEEIIGQLAEELQLKKTQVTRTASLLDEGNTIPFIARYRKEATGSLDEDTLRRLRKRLDYMRNLLRRKDEIRQLIDKQDKLDDELRERISTAGTLQELEDLYRPYRSKRRTRADRARRKGLEPLAQLLWDAAAEDPDDDLSVEDAATGFVDADAEVCSAEDALAGARDIIAEWVANDPDHRDFARRWMQKRAQISTRLAGEKPQGRTPYEMYYDYEESVQDIKPHRVLAIDRAEREEILRVRIQLESDQLIDQLHRRILLTGGNPAAGHVAEAIADGYRRLMGPSIKRQLRSQMTERAQEHAIEVFAENLEQLLLQPPVRNAVVMGIDPAFRTGCKVAVVDESGAMLQTDAIYPTPPRNDVSGAQQVLECLIEECRVDIIAIGNGTASRQTEEFVAGVLRDFNRGRPVDDSVRYTIVNEAGASVYSASALARKEFPQLDVSRRSAVSIARRLQDPLAELVKIDPRAIGVGQYQHDVDQTRLQDTLDFVVEKCVNRVGVDLASASEPLLERVSGLGPAAAERIVQHRRDEGFCCREDLLQVRGIGPKTFRQAAGFLRLFDSGQPLDATAIHPESYDAALRLLRRLDAGVSDVASGGLPDVDSRLPADEEKLADELGTGLPTLRDILAALRQPGRDPRQDMPPPVFRGDVLSTEDLSLGMYLRGTVRNVVDFGAFVDIGVKRDGLVHISELSDGYVSHPSDVVSVGDVVRVMVMDIDRERQRISLSMRGVKQDDS